MRGLAKKLGVGTMSIYWYVPSKDDLLDLVVDAVRGEIEVPDPGTGDWRTNSSILAHNTRRVLLRHQWMVNLAAVGPPVGSHTLSLVDHALALFDHSGADPMTVVSSFMAIDTFVMGYVMREQQERANDYYERALSHDEIEDLAETYHDYMQQYPHIQAMIRAGIDPDSPDSRDERFEFGLECLLDGIAARLPSK